jgi:hypothetical protein
VDPVPDPLLLRKRSLSRKSTIDEVEKQDESFCSLSVYWELASVLKH